MKNAITIVLLAALSQAVFAGELYRYVDKDGRVTYSDMPPPKSAKKIERKSAKEATPEATLPFATRDAAKKFPVTLYANDCGDPCNAARTLLETRGVPYAQKDPSVSEQDAAALTKLVGALEVPVMVVGKLKHIKGYQAQSWNAALDDAGYPKTNPGVKRSPTRRKDDAPAAAPPTNPSSAASMPENAASSDR